MPNSALNDGHFVRYRTVYGSSDIKDGSVILNTRNSKFNECTVKSIAAINYRFPIKVSGLLDIFKVSRRWDYKIILSLSTLDKSSPIITKVRDWMIN